VAANSTGLRSIHPWFPATTRVEAERCGAQPAGGRDRVAVGQHEVRRYFAAVQRRQLAGEIRRLGSVGR
jgi:hypothetical protein